MVGPAVDEYPLFGPRLEQVSAPDEVVEHAAFQACRPTFRHRAHGECLVVEAVGHQHRSRDAPAGQRHGDEQHGHHGRTRAWMAPLVFPLEHGLRAPKQRHRPPLRIQMQRQQRQRGEREQLDVPLRQEAERDRHQRHEQHRHGGPPAAPGQRGHDGQERQQENLAVDGVEVGRHELLRLPQDRAVAEEAEHVREQPPADRIEQAAHERNGERRRVVLRACDPHPAAGAREQPLECFAERVEGDEDAAEREPPVQIGPEDEQGHVEEKCAAGRVLQQLEEHDHEQQREEVRPREPMGGAQHGSGHAHQIGEERVAAPADQEPGNQCVCERQDQAREHRHTSQAGGPECGGVDQLAPVLER